MTNSNHRHSQLSLQQIVIGNMTELVFLPHNFFVVSKDIYRTPTGKVTYLHRHTLTTKIRCDNIVLATGNR